MAVLIWILVSAFVALGPLALSQTPVKPLSVAEVLALPDTAGQARIPVRVRGVLTYYEPGHRMGFLQDETDAIYIHVISNQDVAAGDFVEVQGFVDPGLKGRNIMGPDFQSNPVIRRISRGTFPEPFILRSLERLEKEWGARWMQAELQIADVSLEGDRARLRIAGHPDLMVYISGITRPSLLPGHLRGLRVKAHGVLADAAVSTNPLVMQRRILVPGLPHVTIPKEEIDRFFSGPEATLADLKWLSTSERGSERTKVRGVVTWIKPGEGFFIQRGTVSAWVQCSEPTLPALSQRVICAGTPSNYQGVGILRNAMWTECLTELADIDPIGIEAVDFAHESNHGRLVRVRGKLVEILRSPTESLMILEVGKEVVFSHFRSSKSLPVPERGSMISTTGIFLNRPSPISEFADSPESFHLLPRTSEDMRILAAPSFWNLKRVVIALCAVLAATLLTMAWVLALRRKVRKQAGIIRKTVAKQAVEEERVRIAREWHDTFEQHFAGLTMLMDAAATTIPGNSPAGGMLERAARMADHSRSEARQAVWDLRDPQHGGNKPFVAELEETIRHAWPEDAACRIHFRSKETKMKLPRPVALQLFRIASEAVTNAFKHSACDEVTVSWNDDGDSWTLAIQDDGNGMPIKAVEHASVNGHFGLLGMRERALRLQASLQILSPPASGIRGTLIRLILPKSTSKP